MGLPCAALVALIPGGVTVKGLFCCHVSCTLLLRFAAVQCWLERLAVASAEDTYENGCLVQEG